MDERNLSTSDLAGASAEETPEEATPKETRAAADEPIERERADVGQSSAVGESQRDDEVAGGEPLFPADEAERFNSRWTDIQTGFVDEPREAVEQADALVADLMQRLAASFSAERQQLERQWDSGDDVSTEDLRVALTRYRSFFGRLLSA